jgi:hydroxypyruvate isomerase
MRLTICLSAALILCAASTQADARTRHHAAKPAAFQINETSWTYVEKKMKVRETIDKDGNYIENAVSGKHIDHGTAVMKDGKACFTSAMTKEGELCWTAPKYAVAIGHSFVTTSDKGRKLRVTRIKYTPLKMPG